MKNKKNNKKENTVRNAGEINFKNTTEQPILQLQKRQRNAMLFLLNLNVMTRAFKIFLNICLHRYAAREWSEGYIARKLKWDVVCPRFTCDNSQV